MNSLDIAFFLIYQEVKIKFRLLAAFTRGNVEIYSTTFPKS
jgi:hypothetical protein